MTAEPEGATPLEDEEFDGLIPGHITTRHQLNEWEAANILAAEAWVFSRRRTEVLSVVFLAELHRRMFDRTWEWAGLFRATEKNIGVAPERICENLVNACADAVYWVEHNTYDLPEAAARFHHRVVQIHPFANGNGRHGRLAADVLLVEHGVERFEWGGSLGTVSDRRSRYLTALRSADGGDLLPLLRFLDIT